jgi:hypothetical protein
MKKSTAGMACSKNIPRHTSSTISQCSIPVDVVFEEFTE